MKSLKLRSLKEIYDYTCNTKDVKYALKGKYFKKFKPEIYKKNKLKDTDYLLISKEAFKKMIDLNPNERLLEAIFFDENYPIWFKRQNFYYIRYKNVYLIEGVKE